MIVLVAIGGVLVLLGLIDLTDFLFARAGKRSLLTRGRHPLAKFSSARRRTTRAGIRMTLPAEMPSPLAKARPM
jgi:hypothetical protein